jgi:hypothetical protein
MSRLANPSASCRLGNPFKKSLLEVAFCLRPLIDNDKFVLKTVISE